VPTTSLVNAQIFWGQRSQAKRGGANYGSLVVYHRSPTWDVRSRMFFRGQPKGKTQMEAERINVCPLTLGGPPPPPPPPVSGVVSMK